MSGEFLKASSFAESGKDMVLRNRRVGKTRKKSEPKGQENYSFLVRQMAEGPWPDLKGGRGL